MIKPKIILNTLVIILAALVFGAEPLSAQAQVRFGDTIPKKPAHDARSERWAEARAFDLFTNGLIYDELKDSYRAARSYNAALGLLPESAEIRYSLANAYIELGEIELALQIAGEVDPVNSDILRVMAKAYRQLGDTEAYRATYVQMTKTDPESAQAFRILSKMYLRMAALDSAQWALEHLLRITPSDRQNWNRLGRVRLSLKEYAGALEAFDKSLEIDRTLANLNGLLGLADVFEAMDQPDSELSTLREALELAGPNPMLLNRIASNLTSRDLFGEATGYVRQLTRQVPRDNDQLRRLGMLFYYADSLDQAEIVFDSLLLRNDSNDFNHIILGQIYLEREEPAMARDQFRLVTEMAGSTADSWVLLAMSYRAMGEVDSSLATYRRGLEQVVTAEDSVRLIYAAGATQEELDQVDNAISSFEWVLVINPDYHQAMNYLGYLLADRNIRLDYALELISRAVTFQPENSAYLDSYGWVYYRMGQYDKALKYLERAVALDSDPVMFDHLGDVHSATGDRQEARTFWNKALELDPDNETIKEKLED